MPVMVSRIAAMADAVMRLVGCVAFMGPHYLAGNGAHFSVVLKLENVCRTNE
jgi:hypothetical protein